VEMHDEELNVPDDVLEETSAKKYQMLPTKSKLRKNLQLFQETIFASFYWKRRTKSGSFRKLN
jgi:hypothetical protein